MLSAAILKSIQVYGIAIVVSLIVAVLIKIMVKLTTPAKRSAEKVITSSDPAKVQAAQKSSSPSETKATLQSGTADEVVAAISAALATVIGPHKILRISEKDSS